MWRVYNLTSMNWLDDKKQKTSYEARKAAMQMHHIWSYL